MVCMAMNTFLFGGLLRSINLSGVLLLGKEPFEIAHNQHRLALFYELGAYLTEKGLVG